MSVTIELPDTAASPIPLLISLLMGASYSMPACTERYFKAHSSCGWMEHMFASQHSGDTYKMTVRARQPGSQRESSHTEK